ncbi:MAG: aspartate/glutamate racemase family protein [Hyphomicrobiaceae bacterium]
MRIRVINPNTTAAMTETIARAAREAAAAGTEIDAVTSPTGPVSIEGYYDEALSLPSLLMEIRKGEVPGVAGHVIACFDDTGLDAARQIAAAPVVGIGEAACHLATLVAHRFTIVTTLRRSVPALEYNMLKYGFEDEKSDARARIDAEVALALVEDRAEAIVLGCAGMAKLASDLSAKHGCPVIDGVGAAVKLVEALAAPGLRTSKLCGYDAGAPKRLTGAIAQLVD